MAKAKWEYHVAECTALNAQKNVNELRNMLEECGEEGWELVSVVNGWLIFKRTLKLVLLFLALAGTADAQTGDPTFYTRAGQTAGQWTGCRQTVIISDNGRQRHFEREEMQRTTTGGRPGTGLYGPWRELPPFTQRPPRIQYNAKDWPKAVDPKTVKRIMGNFVWDYFERVNNRAIRSGHFNLTADPKLDWYEFSGTTFGTKTDRLPRDNR